LRRPLLVFVLGVWGAGKSSLGRGLAGHGFLHIEIDRWLEGSGIDLAGLRREWDAFAQQARIVPLVDALSARAAGAERGAVALTLPSGVIPAARHRAALHRARIRTLIPYGTAAECLDGWLAREREHGRPADAERWIASNALPYARFSAPEHADHRVASFRGGAFVGADALAAAALANLRQEPRNAAPTLVQAN